MREVRKLRRRQRQKLRQERRNHKDKGIPQQHHYHHRKLKLNEYDNSEENGFSNNHEVQNNVIFRQKFKGKKQSPRKQLSLSHKRPLPIDRQASIFVATPAGIGMAWFASLFGLAAMVREPLSTVLGGVYPWSHLLNSKYPINHRIY